MATTQCCHVRFGHPLAQHIKVYQNILVLYLSSEDPYTRGHIDADHLAFIEEEVTWLTAERNRDQSIQLNWTQSWSSVSVTDSDNDLTSVRSYSS